MAARGHLNTGLLGQLIAVLVRDGALPSGRLIAALRLVMDMGAPGLVWSILAAALPVALHDRPVHGAGELLALAVECASLCGATGEIEVVSALAAKPGTSQTAKNAKILRAVLLRGTALSPCSRL